MDSQPQPATTPESGKKPLMAVATAVITLAAIVFGKFNPAVGDWINANSDSLLTVVALLGATTKPVDWKALLSFTKKF